MHRSWLGLGLGLSLTLTLTLTRTLTLTLTSYRSMDRSLTDEEINALQNTMRERAADELAVELR